MERTRKSLAGYAACPVRVASKRISKSGRSVVTVVALLLTGAVATVQAEPIFSTKTDSANAGTVQQAPATETPGVNVDPGAINDDAGITPPIGLADDLAEQSFNSFDADGNGEIRMEERPTDPYMTEKRFNTIDANADGSIDQFEFEDFQDSHGE